MNTNDNKRLGHNNRGGGASTHLGLLLGDAAGRGRGHGLVHKQHVDLGLVHGLATGASVVADGALHHTLHVHGGGDLQGVRRSEGGR